jgi:hypothetical protein
LDFVAQLIITPGDTTMKRILTYSLAVLLCTFTLKSLTLGFDGAVLPIPAGTKVSMELLSPISTSTSKKGDKFSCRILTPAEYVGAIAEGHIQELKRSGKADKDSKINLEFDSVTLPNGRRAELNATVVEVFDVVNTSDQGRADNEGTVRNKSTTVKTSVKRAVAGALIGAIVGGVIAGAPGAAQGAMIGAGIGVSTVLATRGPDLNFKEGTQFTVECNGPTGKKKISNGRATGTLPQLKPRAPDPPSQQWVVYAVAGSYSLSHPENWKALPGSNEVTFAPERGSIPVQGRSNVTHGVLVGVVSWGITDLQVASDRLLSGILQQNTYLRSDSDFQRVTIGARPVFSVGLTGRSPFSNEIEAVRLNVALLSGGRVFYAITVVPQQDLPLYQSAFDDLLKSVQFRDQLE